MAKKLTNVEAYIAVLSPGDEKDPEEFRGCLMAKCNKESRALSDLKSTQAGIATNIALWEETYRGPIRADRRSAIKDVETFVALHQADCKDSNCYLANGAVLLMTEVN